MTARKEKPIDKHTRLALMTGAISTIITFLNFLVNLIKLK